MSEINGEFIARCDSIGIPNSKTGNVFTAIMHIFTAVVGAGVLNLPYSTAWLGWIAGPSLITLFFILSLISAIMLAQVFEVNGIEHERYHHMVNHLLGRRGAIWASVFQLINIFLVMWAYSITGGNAIVAIAQVSCEYTGADLKSSKCFYPATGGVWKGILIFGCAQLLISQVRNLEEAWWVSVFGTIGSLMYSFIALILGMAHASNGLGSVGGNAGSSPADKTFEVLNALGSIAFAYNFSLILPEIQATIKQPPSAIKTMKKASSFAITGSYIFYVWIAIAGYAALGSSVQPVILDSFCGPNWAIMLAQIAILIHMLSAYQVFGQALFNTTESHVKYWLLNRGLRQALQESGAVPGHPDTIEEGEERGEDDDDADHVKKQISPFDAAKSGRIEPSSVSLTHERVFGFDHFKFEPIETRISSVVSGQILGQETLAGGSSASLGSIKQRRGSVPVAIIHDTYSRAHESQLIEKKKRRLSMFSVDTGFANEEVILNDEGAVLPLRYRLVLRSIQVTIITVLACIMPFFGAFVGLAGAVTWYPLAIFFPFAAYRKVYSVTKGLGRFLNAISFFTLLVAIAATIGSVRSIVVGFSSYSIFGTADSAPVTICTPGTD